MGETLQLDLAGAKVPVYVAGGEGRPGLIVLQEIFGVNANIRAITDSWAAAGYRAAAPDVYHQTSAGPGVELDPGSVEDRPRAMALSKELDFDRTMGECAALADWLRGETGKAGCVGYCLGGRLAVMAWRTGVVDAAASYYGVGIDSLIEGGPDTPLMLHVAEQDHLCPPEAQEKIFASADAFPQVEAFRYDGCGHAFAREKGEHYNPAAAETAGRRTAEFMRRHLMPS